MNKSLNGKKILISAGASGIGWATAKICLSKGATVYICDIETKYIAKMFNYVVVLCVALALNDLAKYYINRSIKFSNGTHMYYVYYSVGLLLVTYIISKSVNRM